MRARPLIVWILVGALGLALAAGVSYAATQLSNQRIGLAAEPPSAGEELAPVTPRTTSVPAHRVHRHRTARPRTTSTAAPSGSAGSAGDDSGEGGSQRGSGGGQGRDD